MTNKEFNRLTEEIEEIKAYTDIAGNPLFPKTIKFLMSERVRKMYEPRKLIKNDD